MFIENRPFISDEFLDELAKEINQQYGGTQMNKLWNP